MGSSNMLLCLLMVGQVFLALSIQETAVRVAIGLHPHLVVAGLTMLLGRCS